MSKPFIRVNEKDWDIENKYELPLAKDIPVISVIGTSRDGKSTLLNIFDNYMRNQTNNPFLYASGEKRCTCGIDFHKTDKYMLIDCEGMMHKGAKNDHYLALIVYLISNVVILNVRQRLDLQIMNNMIGVFSFLAEIPDEYRRKDKPILFIRIKDFQDMELLEQNENYLNEIINEWLQPNDDQYDKLKEAFRDNFTIQIGYTFNPTNQQNKGRININSPNFLKENDSFANLCKNIWDIAKTHRAPYILSSSQSIIDLVDKLKKNTNIDWKKLDLYHQLAEKNLYKYVNEYLLKTDLNDMSLIDKMNGMKQAYELYISKEKSIKQAEDESNHKFKDIAESIRNEILYPVFAQYYENIAFIRGANHEKALLFITPYYNTFKSKYVEYGKSWDNVQTKILEWYEENKKIFVKYLDMIDTEVADDIHNEIVIEFTNLMQLQRQITNMNKKQTEIMNDAIKLYNPQKTFTQYLEKNVNDLIADKKYNTGIELLYDVWFIVYNDIKQIFQKNNIVYYLKSTLCDTVNNVQTYDHCVDSCSGKMAYDFEKFVPEKQMFEPIFWKYMDSALTSIGFLPSYVKPDILANVQFVKISCYEIVFLVTKEFAIKNGIISRDGGFGWVPKRSYTWHTTQCEDQNVTRFEIGLINTFSDCGSAAKLFEKNITDQLIEILAEFCGKRQGLEYHNFV